jgi:hypothetical protein
MLMDIVYEYRDDEYQPAGKIKGRSGKKWNQASSNFTGESLFTRLLPTRTCNMTGISRQFCTCLQPVTNEITDVNRKLVQEAVEKFIIDNNCSDISTHDLSIVHMSAWGVSQLVSFHYQWFWLVLLSTHLARVRPLWLPEFNWFTIAGQTRHKNV